MLTTIQRRHLLNTAMCVVFYVVPGLAWTQSQPPELDVRETSTEAQGRVEGVVFGIDQLPTDQVQLTLDGENVDVDENGTFRVGSLAFGPHEISANGVRETFELGPDNDAVEILVSLTRDGARFDLEGGVEPKAQEVSPEVETTEPGTIRGTVTSLEDDRPVSDARIFVRGQEVEVATDANGSFMIQLRPGTYDISVIHPDFSSQDVARVEVESGETTGATVELSPAAVELDDFTITAPRIEGGQADLLAERRESSNVTEVLGAEQMSKQGASDAADALSRVTGITVVGGKFVYVRGLGDRYSATLLNGATLPSPEPERRVVPLDLFPTSMLESVVVQKSYSPDMPGEFGGGVVELRTRRLPSEFEADLGMSVGFRTGSTFETAPTYQGGALDFLGFDDGTRGLPDPVAAASEDSQLREGDRFSDEGFTPSELEVLGESFPNTWELQSMTLPPNMGIDGSIGDAFDFDGWKTGYRLGATWSQDWSVLESTERYFRLGAGNELEVRNEYDFVTAEREIVIGMIFTTGIEFGEDHQIYLTSLLDRVSDDEARQYSGFFRDVGGEINVSRFRWVERMLLYQQIRGEHTFEDLKGLNFDWHYVFSQAQRDEPDRKEFRYDERPDGGFVLSDRPEGNSRVFSGLVDNAHDINFEITLPFRQWSSLDSNVSLGAAAVLKNREVDTRRYAYTLQERDERLALPPEELFTPENIGPGEVLQLTEATRSTDNYTAEQQILASWLSGELPISKSFEIGGGVRLEYSKQRVETRELFNPDADLVPAELSTLDPLPALSATWGFFDDMKLRAVVSRTVSRPDFRELSPLTFTDVTGGRAVQGNPELERAVITHADLRYEWYPTKTESVSIGTFLKSFESPIESEIRPGAQPLVTYQNAKSALNLGVEIEARKNFEFLAKSLRDLFIATNFSLIDSSVDLAESGSQTNSERPLQGQSPWVVNLSIGYDNVEIGTSASILYNVSGRRITSVGALGLPDVYEEPVHSLDAVYKQKLGDSGFKASFKATNLIDPAIEFAQGARVQSTTRLGRKFSFGLGYDF